MAEEGENAAREGVASRSTGTEDYKTQCDAAIDAFKSKYSSDFGNRDFALAFNRQLKTWKRDAGEVKIKDVERQIRWIYRQVKDEIAKWEDEELGGQPELSTAARITIMAEQDPKAKTPVKTPEKEGSRAKQPVQKHAATIKLNDVRAQALDAFASNDKYKAEFRRYPLLRQKMEELAVDWVLKDTGKNFVLALQKIFEEQVVACFFRSQTDTNSAHGLSAEQLQAAVNAWKKQANNLGKPVYSEDLQKIWDSLKQAPGIAVHKQTTMQLANAAVQKFMQRAEVGEECKNHRTMQADLNKRIASWLENGGHSADPDLTVRGIYHLALIEHFQNKLAPGIAGGESPIAILVLVFEAANKWSNTNVDQVLTTPILNGLLDTSVLPRQ
jgi:hypothetical protein